MTRLNEEQSFGTNDVLCALTQSILNRIILCINVKTC